MVVYTPGAQAAQIMPLFPSLWALHCCTSWRLFLYLLSCCSSNIDTFKGRGKRSCLRAPFASGELLLLLPAARIRHCARSDTSAPTVVPSACTLYCLRATGGGSQHTRLSSLASPLWRSRARCSL
jgi:hypothetical protein